MTETHTPPIGTDANGDWISVSYENSWVDYDARVVKYRLNGKGFVELKGLAKTGVVNQVMFTLPVGYRPEYHLHMICASNSAYGQFYVGSTGGARLQVGSNVWASCQMINFKADTTAPGIEHKPLIGEDGATDWVNLSYLNGWVNYGAVYPPLRYMKDIDGIVYLEGLIKSGGIGSACATLPAGYRPAKREIYGTVSNNLFAECRIYVDGTVMPRTGSNTWYSWSGISFKAEN